MAFGAYRAAKARAAGGVDGASLAGNDQSDPFDFFKYTSSAFFCANSGGVPLTSAFWNGQLQLEAGTLNSGVFTCTCLPAFNASDGGILALGGGPLTIITPVAGALTGDFWNISYSGANSKIVTIDYNIAAGTPKFSTLAFFVLVIHSRSQQTFNNKSIALDGGDEGTSITDY